MKELSVAQMMEALRRLETFFVGDGKVTLILVDASFVCVVEPGPLANRKLVEHACPERWIETGGFGEGPEAVLKSVLGKVVKLARERAHSLAKTASKNGVKGYEEIDRLVEDLACGKVLP